MFDARIMKRTGAIAVMVGICLALSACLLTPGKFEAKLDVRRDGRFSYSYTGEIYLLALSRLAQMAQRDRANPEFVSEPCFEEDGVEERECTSEELAEQRSSWELARQAQAQRQERDSTMMKAMLGGIDPADPAAAEELAARLRRQVGWNRVEYRGNGLFDVEFAISGRLDHDFQFPTLERFPMANVFVSVLRRNDGTIRIEAPGFAPAQGGDPFRGIMMAATMAEQQAGEAGEDGDPAPAMPELEGRFTIITNAAILANNADEGPKSDRAGEKLEWPVSIRTPAAPMALLRLND